jgi:predicted AAA+ superfamily ATPase
MPKEYIRWATKTVQKATTVRRIVSVSGARQAGKTTLTKQAISKNNTFRTLDDPAFLKAALDSPKEFILHNKPTLVIDEIQKAPILLPIIKMQVDNDNRNRQFVITGSADVQSLPEVNESLAGRIKNVRLRTLTEGEIRGIEPTFLDNMFNKKFPFQLNDSSKKDILNIAFRGGYPEILLLSEKDKKDWHKEYINILLTRDLREITNIRKIDILEKMVLVLASWSSKFINIDTICKSFEISKQTVNSYINSLENLYIFDKLSSWIKTDYERVNKKDKWFITDTGLIASLLNWKVNDVLLDVDKPGKIVETLVFNELSAIIGLNNEYSLYHYRDREQREIDFIVEREDDGALLLIETKAGSNISEDDFVHIEWFKNNLAKDKKCIGIILYSGKDTLHFGKDLVAIPTASLWNNW